MMFFLLPTLWYGFITIKEKFPISEACARRRQVRRNVGRVRGPRAAVLALPPRVVGYVELGTDSWITNIMERVKISAHSVLLLVYTAGLMFVLRFFAGPIVERINPLGLLFVSAVPGLHGFVHDGQHVGQPAPSIGILVAATIYGVGKTFLWPTMLGVVGECFPKGGALTMGAMGGVGMLSAGLLGGPGIGYTQDVNATAKLRELNPAVFDQVKSDEQNSLLVLPARRRIRRHESRRVAEGQRGRRRSQSGH